MRTCIVCSSNPSNEDLSFHRLPKDCVIRNKWITVCNLNNKMEHVKDPVVCSKHFMNSDYDETRKPYKILKKESVPSRYLNQLSLTHDLTDKGCGIIQITVKLNSNVLTLLENEGSPPDTFEYLGDLRYCENLTKKQFNHSEEVILTDGTSIYNNTPDARYIGDLQVKHFNSPRKAKRHIKMVKDYVGEQRDQIKRLKKENAKLTRTITNMEDLMTNICEQNLLNEQRAQTLMDSLPDNVKEIVNRQLASKNTTFTPELRSFALTLHFYSPKAYNYVRSVFNNLLPHPRTIQKWYSVIDGEPGFTKEVFEAIKFRVKNSKGSRPIVINLVLDEMAIRQKVEYCGNKLHGYVEIGTNCGIYSDQEYDKVEATNALVLMAVALNENWKAPLGYFLIKSLTAQERAKILQQCLILLEETGVKCHSITFDGAAVNISMCKILGANYTSENFKPFFPHPVTDQNVYTFFDACHMLKLCRNAFCDKGVLYDLNGLKIEWQYITRLVEIQQSEGLRAANKLTNRHVNYKNEIMKVFLAAQTMSASVASALCLCKTSFKGFENCEATANFCLVINNIFDMLNCKNKYANGTFLRALNDNTFDLFQEKANIFINYLEQLKDNIGIPFINGNRKTGFLGFIIDLKNIFALYKDLKLNYNFEYLLSFKLSQDHLETFFSAIRSRGGCNNNPSCLQFKASYKKLVVKHEVSGSKYGNCSILDAATILHVSSGVKSQTTDRIVEEALADFELELNLENENFFFNKSSRLSPFIEDIVIYISGFVSKKAKSKILCEICRLQLTTSECNSHLIKFKNRGNLQIPSDSVIRLCRQLELGIRFTTQATLLNKKNIKELLTLQTIRALPNLFGDEVMTNHIKNQSIIDNHRTQLIKLICNIYLTIRIHHECKKMAEKINRNKIRTKFNKIVLFKNE